ncbi:DUF2690 domain-containing protein [Streptomyces sp. NPDC049954]|uniref:helix-turn-helix domain-containing protein n=1 Tax=Streptomyces sp. NPDC049954 TaxID=3155779 RepID=UPI00342C22D3
MPRWKALPDGLDPQIREFTSQLRRLVDRSGLGVAAVADHTGYSRTSWERYLNGRLLAPQGAIVALAEVTGANPEHLTTMWELAERAWSRSELRHDMTMEAIRISQARAALGEPGPAVAGTGAPSYADGGVAVDVAAGRPAGPAPHPDGARPGERGEGPAEPVGAVPPESGGPDARRRRGRRLTMFFAGLAGVLVLVAAVLSLTGSGSGGDQPASAKEPAASAREASPRNLPAGVECTGRACEGRDPERMGCSGGQVRTTARATVGDRLVEVRYSEVCRAAWARITRAGPGDRITVSAGGSTRAAAVEDDAEAYTPMVAVPEADGARACAKVSGGAKGCTKG